MNIDYNTITVTVAILSSLIAIYAVVSESKRSSFSLRMDLLFKINDQFNNPDFSRKRKVAAKFILKLKDKSDYNNWTSTELDELLDFFQAIASLTERGALDKVIVWEYYSYWLHGYYEASKEYIEFCQKEYPQTWEGVEWLHKAFIKIESDDYKHTKKRYAPPSQTEINQFLIDESKLYVSGKR